MANTEFYDTPEQQSIVKTEIVFKYFRAWSRVMLNQQPQRIAYIDLFSGPGVFADGTASTPISILSSATQDEALRTRLVTSFNDKDAVHATRLQAAINELPGIENLTYRPRVSNAAVGSDAVELFRDRTLVPTLFFIDPWGYKGLSLDLIGAAIKSWGCECIFFFNYNRIRPGLDNPLVANLMAELFGVDQFKHLRDRVGRLPIHEREPAIINAMTESLKQVGGRYVLPFRVGSGHGERTSHYIIFVSKRFRGYHIMKEVMEALSSDDGEVKSLEFLPVKSAQLRLLDLNNPHSIPALKAMVVQLCAGRQMTIEATYEFVTVDTPYTLRHVKKAISELEMEGKVQIDVPAKDRPKRKGEVTLSDKRVVTFPAEKGCLDGSEVVY